MHPDWYAEDAQDRAKVWVDCHRCGKRTTAEDVHTCTPPAIVAELEAQLAQAQAELHSFEDASRYSYWGQRAAHWRERAEAAEAQVAALARTQYTEDSAGQRFCRCGVAEADLPEFGHEEGCPFANLPDAAQRLLAADKTCQQIACRFSQDGTYSQINRAMLGQHWQEWWEAGGRPHPDLLGFAEGH